MESPQILTTSSSGRRRKSSASNSPEFEFWMVRNPSFPEPNLHSADELFSDGVLLPLHLLHHHHSDDPPPENPNTTTTNAAVNNLSQPPFTASKRWKDIFKKSDKNKVDNDNKEKEKKKERKNNGGGGSGAELNINLWPFSRSRSAGTGGSRPRMAAPATRKVSSAPCSRSNSAGESKSNKLRPSYSSSSPSRGGIQLGRSSPVWQVRRVGSGRNTIDPVVRNAEKGRSKKSTAAGYGGAKANVLNVNVPTCIGYRHHLSCKSVDGDNSGVATSGNGGRGSNLFNLKGLFTKKVY